MDKKFKHYLVEFDTPQIYCDMDGVLADFEKGRFEHPLSKITPYIGRPDKLPGIYENLEPISNSVESVSELFDNPNFDVYFLSSAPWDNPEAWTHKRLWVAKYFDEKIVRKRLILSHHKHLLIGDYLIDDNPWNGASEFQGKWIHFGSKYFPDWKTILEYLKK